MTGLMGQLQTQNAAQKQQFQQQQSGQGLATLANALLAGAEGTRGRKGSGIGEAFLGIGKTYSAAQAAADKRQQEQAAIERAQSIEMAKLQADVDNMQRAFAEGRVEDGMKYKAAVQAREAKIAELQGMRSKDVLSLADTRRQREEQKRHNQETEKYQKRQGDIAAERAGYERENRPSKEEKTTLSVMSRLNADPQYKSLLTRQAQFNPADPEFSAIQDVLDSIRDAAFKDAKLAPPTKRERLQPILEEPKKGFLQRMFGGSPTPPKTTAVPFDQLPK
jgi:murein L,D-transpeptidase YcbB/YkuD